MTITQVSEKEKNHIENLKVIDDFKTYEGYEYMYILESYIRHEDIDTVIHASYDYDEIESLMDEDTYMYLVNGEGLLVSAFEWMTE